MDPHLRLLQEHGLAEFQLLQKELISTLLTRIPYNLVETLHSEECYDEWGVRADGYRPEVLHPVRAFCIDCFTSDAPVLDVLLVERGEPDPFYLSPRSEIRGGARLRRSVPNADELAEALIRSGRQVTRMRPETLDLRDQIRAFSRAKVVVAQHGAALSNVLWMASGSRVVEIIPRKKDPRDHFSRIAEIVGATYVFVHQDGNHAPVKPQTLLEAVNVHPSESTWISGA